MKVWSTRAALVVILLLIVPHLGVGCTSSTLGSSGHDPSEPDTVMEQGRRYTNMLYQGQADRLYGLCSARVQQGLQVQRLLAIQTNLAEKLGREQEVLDERLDERLVDGMGQHFYVRTARFAKSEGTFQLWWALDADLDVAWFFVGPQIVEVDQEYVDYEVGADLWLPFSGSWLVLWGGREVEDNLHVDDPEARFAVDFVLAKGASLHRGDGSRNQHYYCFGQPILAPGNGMIVESIDGVPDNAPGIENYRRRWGNHVILYHGQGEYSVLANLKEGSIRVAPQQQVQAGEKIGQCGNSGESAFPHLHFHLQNRLSDGHGLPAQFQDYVADGKRVERGEPTRGQWVKP